MQSLPLIKSELAAQFENKFRRKPQLLSIAPGRINIIGEHTDYNLGLSMPAAINRWVVIAFAKREDPTLHIVSANFDSEIRIDIGQLIDTDQSWKRYVGGALEIFEEEDMIDSGFDALLWGNVPVGSGVSSSAAFEVALMQLLRYAFDGQFDDVELVKKCQRIEHEYVGVKSGLLDQYASYFSREGKIMILDFKDLSHTYADADMGEYCWVLANTKVKRELSGSKYTERVEETKKALEMLSQKHPEIQHFRDILPEHISSITDATIAKRIKHFVTENIRVKQCAEAFAAKDYSRVGHLLYQSHESLQTDYEVSCEELDYYVRLARDFEGCAGARMMGGGFGGCTINLLKKSKLAEFSEYMLSNYKRKFQLEGEVNAFDCVAGASVEPC